MSERVLIPVADGELPAYLWVPESGTGPGVVLVQEIFGLSPYIHRRAADLAARGIALNVVPVAKPAERYTSIIGGHGDLLYEQAGDVKAFL